MRYGVRINGILFVQNAEGTKFVPLAELVELERQRANAIPMVEVNGVFVAEYELGVA